MVDYLFLVARFNGYSGPNNHILDLSNYLYTKCKKSLVLVTHPGFAESDFSREIKFPTIRILRRSARVRSNVKAIKNVIRRLSPRRTFVNCDLNLAFQTYFASNAQLFLGYNVFWAGDIRFSFSRDFVKSAFFTLRDKLGSGILVKKVVAHTDFHRKAYIRIGIEPNKISVIPHCLDLDRLYRALRYGRKIEKNDIPTILFARRLTKDKGIIELLRAYKQISKKMEARFLIVGSGPLERKVQKMKRRIERENTKAHITHMKRVTLPKLMCLIDSADVVAIPSRREMFGLVALEAMALKKAVLATCFGGISEVITNGVNGILVNPLDSHEMESRLEELLLDQSERVKLGNAAYQTIKNNYDVSVVTPRFMKFLEESV